MLLFNVDMVCGFALQPCMHWCFI